MGLRCEGNPARGQKCILGILYEEDVGSGQMRNIGPCEYCSGEQKAPDRKIVQLPGSPDRKLDAEAWDAGVRQIHNNVMGHVRTPINAKHEEHIQHIRDIGLELYVALHDAGGTDPNQDRFANRNLAIAATELETAVMFAIKGVCERK